MTKLYVAGPMRGKPNFNAMEFDLVSAALRDRGYLVFNPAQRDRREYGADVHQSETGDLADFIERGGSLAESLKADLSWICDQADGIALLDDWQQSLGAKAEIALGAALGIGIREWKEWM